MASAALVVQLASALTDIAGARETGRGVRQSRQDGGGVLRGPGAERPGHQAHRVEGLAPRAAARRPAGADERHEIGGHGLDRVGGAGPGLGERHDGVLHVPDVRLPVEDRSQWLAAEVGPLVEEWCPAAYQRLISPPTDR